MEKFTGGNSSPLQAGGEQSSLSLPWENMPAETGMPGRLQHGQLLHSDDDPGEETDSDGGLQQHRLAKASTSGVQALPSSSLALPKMADGCHPPGDIKFARVDQSSLAQPAPRQDESGTDTDEDGELIRAKAKAAQDKPKPLAKRRVPGKVRAGAGITLGLLIKEGIIWPGKDVLSVEYKSVMTYATLTPDGQIICKINGNESTFESPSAFSIFLKRMVNPNRKADDGWKTVKFNGRFLETYKMELAKQRMAAPGGDEEAAAGDAQPAAKKARLEAAATGQGKAQKPKGTRKPANGHAAIATQVKPSARVGCNLEDENQMIPCERYRGEPGGSTSGCQPFRVVVAPGAALFMDFHAHLSMNEVVGLLAGGWQPRERLLRVERAFPVQEAQSGEDTASAEMDAADEARVRQIITKQYGMRCVGWYHSHPHAATHPSTTDILSQIARQKQHRVPDTEEEPFIGAIVGPYPRHPQGATSDIAYYHIEHPKERELPAGVDPIAEGCLPMEVQVEEEGTSATELYVSSMPQNEMRVVAQRCASSSRRADILGMWRGTTTRLAKVKESISARLPEHWSDKKVEEYLIKADAVVTAAWKFFSQAPAQKERAEEEELEISDLTGDEGDVPHQSHAVTDDASGGSREVNGHRSVAPNSRAPRQAAGEVGYRGTSGGGGGSAQMREDLDEPAAHSYFEHGAGFDAFSSGYEEGGFLEGPMHYRGSLEQYNEDDDISD